jgi:hypothetical protein
VVVVVVVVVVVHVWVAAVANPSSQTYATEKGVGAE